MPDMELESLRRGSYFWKGGSGLRACTGQVVHPDENPDNAVNLGQLKHSYHRNYHRYASGDRRPNAMSHD